MFAHGETVTRLRPQRVTNPYSGAADDYDWTNPDRVDIPGCGVADGGSTEPVQVARDQLEADFDVIMDAGTDVAAQDRLIVRGLTCEVMGRPFDWRHPATGWTPGMVVRCRIVTG